MDKPAFSGNSNTAFLKTAAMIAMLIDHIGYLFFPGTVIFRIIGRISFPLFAYCTVLGFFYTKNLRRYFIRLFAFSLVSQFPYMLCFYPETLGISTGSIVLETSASFFESLHLNIGFTLMLGLFGIYGLERKKYIYTFFAVLLSLFPFFEYGAYGVCFMLVIYYVAFSEKEVFGAAAFITLSSPLLRIFIDGIFDPQCFAALAVPFMLIKTESKTKMPRLIGYGFYPFHLCVLSAINFVIN